MGIIPAQPPTEAGVGAELGKKGKKEEKYMLEKECAWLTKSVQEHKYISKST